MTERDIAQRAERRQRIGSRARALSRSLRRRRSTTPLIEHLDVITEFRRFVLAAEDQLKAGNWMMARGGYDPKGRTLKDLLRPRSGQVSIRARLRFHPQNNYTSLPAFDILLGEPTLLAIDVDPHAAHDRMQRTSPGRATSSTARRSRRSTTRRRSTIACCR